MSQSADVRQDTPAPYDHGATMDNRTDFGTIIVAVCVAAYAAMMIAYVAEAQFGLASAQIRHLSIIAALFVAFPVVLGFLPTRTDKAP